MTLVERLKAKAAELVAEDHAERMAICRQCPQLVELTSTCRECGCFMLAKTKLKNAECPLGKW